MKRILFSLLLLALATPAFAIRTVLVVDEVIRMSKAGVGDDEIVAYVKKTREPFDVSGDDVIAMTDARVSREVIKAVIDESSSRMRNERRAYVDRDDREYGRSRVYFYYDPFWFGSRVYFNYTFGPRYFYYPRYYRHYRGWYRRH